MLHKQILAALNETLDSAEFRALLANKILEKIAPQIPDQDLGDTIVMNTGLAANYDAVGLAHHFWQKLNRRPTATEDQASLVGYMQTLMDRGVSGQRIFESLNERGKSAESVWDFSKRLLAEHAKGDNSYAKMKAWSDKEIARRAAM